MSQPMETKRIQADTDHFKRVSKASADKAIAELIWNAFDGDADNIHVILNLDLVDSSLVVRDDGDGMSIDTARNHFSRVGGSWKRKKRKTEKNRSIHGEKGEGRLKAFSLGSSIIWRTTYRENDKFFRFEVHANSNNIGEIKFTERVEVNGVKTGTEVIISNLTDIIIKDPSRKLAANGLDKWKNSMSEKLTLIFSPTLLTYPSITIAVNDNELDPSIHLKNEPRTTEIKDEEGNILGVLKILLWNDINAANLYLCKEDGAVLEEYIAKTNEIKSLGYKYSAYIQSSLLNEDTVGLSDMDEGIIILLSKSIQNLNDGFKAMKDEEKSYRIDRWIDEGIYPYEKKELESLSPVEKTKRDVFDIVAVNVENKIPKFKKADKDTQKFTFKLLAQALEDNPDAMQKIVAEVLKLSPEEQMGFADLLEKTTLSSIIKSARTVANRLEFLSGLENLIFNHKDTLLERDQLHKILEKEAWVLDEHFALAGSEKRLEDVLTIHLNKLGSRCDDESPVLINKAKQGRVDLMFSKAVQTRPGFFDYLVVELKRPSKKVDMAVIGQLVGYAQAIQQDERFDKTKTNWKFIAISNELDETAKSMASSTDRPKGRIMMADGLEVIVMSWSEVLTNAKARLNFYKNQLNYEASDEGIRQYLFETHEKFLPTSYKVQEEEALEERLESN